jgi:hypothetical protein
MRKGMDVHAERDDNIVWWNGPELQLAGPQ